MKMIDADGLREWLRKIPIHDLSDGKGLCRVIFAEDFERSMQTFDGNTIEIVRCQDCINAVPLDNNCELSTNLYLHCNIWRGEETKNVWHKYKKYYKDYSLVERDGFCNQGTRREEGNDDNQAR